MPSTFVTLSTNIRDLLHVYLGRIFNHCFNLSFQHFQFLFLPTLSNPLRYDPHLQLRFKSNHRLSRVEWRVCCLMSEMHSSPMIAKASSVSHTPLKASTKELMTPSYHPSGRCLISSRSSLMRRISSAAPGSAPNLSQSLALRMFWYTAEPMVTPTVLPRLRARSKVY